ncbi:MAG TPA: DUF2252 domain-containing protein [Candidatus Limnocylindrales bacterium]|jgi:uncharacterized protein (DUF2252 family)
MTRAERAAAGKAMRATAPRSSHAGWSPAADRDDPLDLLESQNRSRVQELVPIRFGRMLTSPFAFLRGSALVMARDLARLPATGIRVQACGDAHLLNYGVFGTQERNLVFGINDFDETYPGAWEWDVKRLAASAVVAARFIGATESQAAEAARSAVRSYRTRMAEYAELGNLELWYSYLDTDRILGILSPPTRAKAEEIIGKARGRTNLQVMAKTTELVGSDFRIIESPPLIVRIPESVGGDSLQTVLAAWLESYGASLVSDRRELLAKYRMIDAVRKVVGVGSVGTRCFVLLLRGEDERDPLFLQVKEATTSVLERPGGRRPYHGKRVVEGQRLLQAAPDIFLGWGRLQRGDGPTVDFYVRQLRDMKGSVDVVPGVSRPAGAIEYTALCGWALALAHARSGDASMISGYLGSGEAFDEAVTSFAVGYADQTERDHEALVKAVKDGRIHAESDGATS